MGGTHGDVCVRGGLSHARYPMPVRTLGRLPTWRTRTIAATDRCRQVLRPLLVLVMVGLAGSDCRSEEVPIPPEVVPGIRHLLELVGPGAAGALVPERISGLMRFVLGSRDPDTLHTAGAALDYPSAYHHMDTRMPLEQVLRYAYHPSIPWFVTCPSSLRLAGWARTDDPWRTLPRLWELNPVDGAPVVIRGLEIVENTPDLFSGAYHRYGQHRTLIYLVWEGRRVFISLSKQAAPSDVGKKGYTLGSDDGWNYFYSGEPGTTIGGLGWFETRLFDSAGIAIYIAPRPGVTRLAFLKWLRAGWSGINVVRNEHIYQGMVRFSRTFKQLMESPALPPVNALEEACRKIEGLTEAGLRERMVTYRQILQSRAESLPGGARGHLPDLFWDDAYWAALSREEMRAILVLETLKAMLGRATDASPLLHGL